MYFYWQALTRFDWQFVAVAYFWDIARICTRCPETDHIWDFWSFLIQYNTIQ